MAEIIVYSNNSCGFCIQLKKFLTEKGIAFEERDINSNAIYFQEFKALGATGTPFTIIKDAGEIVLTVSGFNKEELSNINYK
ncbi:glutaredoxin family protein [Lysinibacillus sp. UGB7]|uniref:glutaredoxin family protein n=1 Tax=Lysinibacillus sp. UGB7 TaxID=3411039 RepID=UPI003B801512